MIKYKTIKAYKTSRPTQIWRLLRCGKGQNERWVYRCHFHDNRNKSFDIHIDRLLRDRQRNSGAVPPDLQI